jgi:hypothetical protein
MRHRFQPLSRLAVASFAWLAVARAGAQLATSSPFLPVKSATSPTSPTADAPLEFRGLIDTPAEGLKVRIYDPARKVGAFLRLNERDPNLDFVVKQYDRAHGTVSVEYHGQTLVLAQHESKVTSLGVANLNVPTGAIPMPSAVTQAAVLNPTPADDQRRLEAVALEVARRRQLREQTTEQMNQPAPVAPVVAAQPPPNGQAQPPQQPTDNGTRGPGQNRAP